MMENLLGAIQTNEAQVAIIDITGVPTVDAAVAHHLTQTVNAVRLMGADCLISAIRPPIAQLMARLGIDLYATVTHATLANALAAAIKLTNAPLPAVSTADR
ncbi:STAS domain-containing protein [Streptomyces sp. G44]|nr:STAS domain-containing protein [Streptomyces sp. G44]